MECPFGNTVGDPPNMKHCRSYAEGGQQCHCAVVMDELLTEITEPLVDGERHHVWMFWTHQWRLRHDDES